MTGDSSVREVKARLRERIRATRAARAREPGTREPGTREAGTREEDARALAERVLDLPELAGAGCLALYAATATEPATAPLIAALLDAGRTVLLPRVRDPLLEWVAVSSDTPMVPGAHAIPEPQAGSPRDLGAAQAIVVPALAVDMAGRRLGQGGGYYDRALIGTTAPVIALVFDDEVLEVIPTQSHDRRVDVIVTPARSIRCG